MEARLLSVDRLSGDELAAWHALVAEVDEPNPFFEPDLLLPAFRHLAPPGVRLLAIAEGERWLAALPVLRRSHFHRRPGPCRVVWLHIHCYVGLPLVAAGAAEPVARALVDSLDEPWLAIPRLPLDSELAQALQEHARCAVLHQAERAVRLGDAPAGAARLSPRGRSELRRRTRRLGEELGGEARMTPGDAEDLLALEHTGWKRREGPSLLSDPAHAAFVRDIAPRLRVDRLGTPERAAAVACAIASGGAHFLFKSAYDESLARCSPGQALAAAMLDDLTGDIDSCAAPDSELVNALLPHRRAFGALAVARPGRLGRLYVR